MNSEPLKLELEQEEVTENGVTAKKVDILKQSELIFNTVTEQLEKAKSDLVQTGSGDNKSSSQKVDDILKAPAKPKARSLRLI